MPETEVVDQARERAQEKAQEVAGQARSRLQREVDERSTQAGEQVRSTASDLRSVSHELRNQGKDTPARLADQTAERVERVGGYLAESDADRILRDVEDFGRRQPLAVLAGGIALGMVAARFLKASSSRRYRSQGTGHNGAVSQPPAFPADVRPAFPDPGEHHQRFEGHG
jgi:glucan phosphorylase